VTTQLIAPSRPAPARHRRIRSAVAIAGVTALAAAGYVAGTTSGPDTTSPTRATGTDVNIIAQAQRELNRSIAGQYGSRSAAAAVVNPSAQTMRELNRSTIGQYGSRSAASAIVNPSAQTMHELHQSVVGQYGPAR